MFDESELRLAVALQKKSYELLKWTADAVDRRLLTVWKVHRYATLAETSYAWIEANYDLLPREARPDRADLVPFANVFSTYLDATFDVIDRPGDMIYPRGGCSCPLCSFIAQAPRLRPKKLRNGDKKRARHLMTDWVDELAESLGLVAPESVHRSSELREARALGAYGKELLHRTRGFSEGPATLVLWRTFAWTPTGAPKRGFELTAERIFEAEAEVLAALQPNVAE